MDTARLAHSIQKDEATARRVIERLVEAGLVEAHGVKERRTHTFSPKWGEARLGGQWIAGQSRFLHREGREEAKGASQT